MPYQVTARQIIFFGVAVAVAAAAQTFALTLLF